MAAAALAAYATYTPFGPPAGTSDAHAIFVDIAPGTPTPALATQLQRAGVIRSRYAFDLLRLLKRGRLTAGEYRFNQPATAVQVYARIVRGDIYTLAVTIPEGYNIFDIAAAVESAGLGSRDDVTRRRERSQTSLIADLSLQRSLARGAYLFPDTYRFSPPHPARPDPRRHGPPLPVRLPSQLGIGMPSPLDRPSSRGALNLLPTTAHPSRLARRKRGQPGL